jgi:hypothetical protein
MKGRKLFGWIFEEKELIEYIKNKAQVWIVFSGSDN